MLWHPIQRHGCAAAGIIYLTAARKDVLKPRLADDECENLTGSVRQV